jgi:prepilin-type N-terminal cleavage/methylation domain-containing protein
MRARAGFTLIEMLVTTAVAAILIASVFAFATFQVRTMSKEQDVTQMHTSARLIIDSMTYDLRNAGFGTSFYAGAPQTAFGGRLAISDGTLGVLGVPAVKLVDAATGDAGEMFASDAISVLRVLGRSTSIPGVGAGNINIPAAPGRSTPFEVADISALQPCANENDPDAPFLVLVSDLARQGAPASMLFELAPIPGPPAASGTPGQISFVSGAYQIDPSDSGRETDGSVPPLGVGPGSIVICVQPVTYYVDARRRLRMWRATRNDPQGVAAITGDYGSVPVNPAIDLVLTEGVEDLQIATFMSGEAFDAAHRSDWAFDTQGDVLASEAHLVEVRALRLSVILRTAIAEDQPRPSSLPPSLEDHVLTLDNRYRYRVVTYQTELRNLRLFDLQASSETDWDDVRSYPQ